ncbi:unnamed protein product [Urochloa humidicola]
MDDGPRALASSEGRPCAGSGLLQSSNLVSKAGSSHVTAPASQPALSTIADGAAVSLNHRADHESKVTYFVSWPHLSVQHGLLSQKDAVSLACTQRGWLNIDVDKIVVNHVVRILCLLH